MEKTVRVCDLHDEAEAGLVCALLERSSIPYLLRRAEDSPYDGIFNAQRGWGYIEAPNTYAGSIMDILASVRESRGNAESK